ncbi:MAG: reductive dehalogenase domain-containing protein [Sneathiella sp.]|uniref:reductive dehalogenase domain-containing protein n=1 Tax=Sneathiella sp. TaxID=1964365 RepID=UPI0030024B22
MFLFPRSKNRPFHFGPFPLETLRRDSTVFGQEAKRPPSVMSGPAGEQTGIGAAANDYQNLFSHFKEGTSAPQMAPLPNDLGPRAVDLKGAAYFLDASMAGICEIPETAWLNHKTNSGHSHALVILLEHARLPEQTNLAFSWIGKSAIALHHLRITEIATSVAGHVRNMGFDAQVHVAGDPEIDIEKLSVLAGLTVRTGDVISAPFIGREFSLAAISMEFEAAVDAPLHAEALRASGLHYWWGQNGAQSGRERRRRTKRASHLSRYPMETVKRIDRPTTLILDDEVPRVPKRAEFFQRALFGDLGAKAQKERGRFAFKTPLSVSLLDLIKALVPQQDGPVAPDIAVDLKNPADNTKAIKSLSYYLGADLTGICEVPNYAWYSHRADGSEIIPNHKYAVVMLIDQGYETMEGASGDDWMSGAQSMRGYLRGAEIAGLMGQMLREKGVASRAQTNADSEVLQIPLILWAGLGELSRIGELVLNPFVGPRFKSVVLTTDLPLIADKPIDFGLQSFCGSCMKCARECPCDAIPFGDKVMFNGYEIWKPDVERCTRYRVTNPKGSACGRCMKTCPINKVVDADGAYLTRVASWMGINAMALKPLMVPIATWLDDKLENGMRNPVKKWWFDHEIIDGISVDPPKGTNQRDIDPARTVDAAKQKMAYYPANTMPAPDQKDPKPVDRKAAVTAGQSLERPSEAELRHQAGGEPPRHYQATKPTGGNTGVSQAKESPYK